MGYRSEDTHIHNLTGLRALAALWVVLVHATYGSLIDFSPYLSEFDRKMDWGAFENIVISGAYAVDVFFILSGFVIFYIYGGRLSLGQTSVFSYAVKRVARIYPVHLFIVIVMSVAYFIGLWVPIFEIGLWDIFFNVTSMYGIFAVPLNIPSWTIPVELFAYLLFPLLLPVLRAVSGRYWLLFCIVSLSCLYSFVEFLMREGGVCDYLGVWCELFQYFRVLCGFVIGCFLCRLYQDGAFGIACPRKTAFLFCVFLFFTICGLFFSLPTLMIYPFFPFVLYYLAASKGGVGFWFGNPVMVYLGRVSYSIYLVHFPVLEVYRAYFDETFMALDRVDDQFEIRLFLVAMVGTVVITAMAVYHLVEEPSRRFIRSWLLGDQVKYDS